MARGFGVERGRQGRRLAPAPIAQAAEQDRPVLPLAPAAGGAWRGLLGLPGFRALWLGQACVSLAVQAFAVALVWLVLEATGSGVALGAVLTVAAVPRALLMLLAGALLDRLPPRLVPLAAALTSGGAVAAVGALALGDLLALWQVFLLAATLGVADAFFFPAALALTARLVDAPRLAPANALVQGTDGLANVLGPAAAGLLIGWLGLPAALLATAALYLLGAASFANLPAPPPTAPAAPREPFGRAVRDGFRYAWRELPIRTSLLVVAGLNFSVLGPMLVGGAILVERRFGGDATRFGLLSAAFGVGMLLGTAAGSLGPQPANVGRLLAAAGGAIGLCLVALGFAPSLGYALPLYAGMGLGFGLAFVRAVTWLQRQAAPEMQGRMASLLVFAAVAADPFSNALAGVLAEWSLTGLFVGAGLLTITTAALVPRPRQASAPTRYLSPGTAPAPVPVPVADRDRPTPTTERSRP